MSEESFQNSNQQTVDLMAQQAAETVTDECWMAPKPIFHGDRTIARPSFGRRGLRIEQASWIL